MDEQTGGTPDKRQSVTDLVKDYSDLPCESRKRDRSESGDPAPAGKRGAGGRGAGPGLSPVATGNRNFMDVMETAMADLKARIMEALSRKLHEFRELFMAEITRVNNRLRDLEQHVEERDNAIADLTGKLRQSRSQVSELQHRVEEA